MSKKILIFGMMEAHPDYAGLLVPKQFAPVMFTNGQTTDIPIQSIETSREKMHKFIDMFFDKLDEREETVLNERKDRGF